MRDDEVNMLLKRIADNGVRKPVAAVLTEVAARGKQKNPANAPNKTERRYGHFLEGEKQAGRILYYKFGSVKLRLADECTYTADYLVMMSDGVLELHDVKAFYKSTGKPGITDDSLAKMKLAAELFPIPVKAVWEQDGVWKYREF